MFVRKSGFLYIWLHMLLLIIATCTSWRVLGDGRPVWGMEDRETDPWILLSWEEWHRVWFVWCVCIVHVCIICDVCVMNLCDVCV